MTYPFCADGNELSASLIASSLNAGARKSPPKSVLMMLINFHLDGRRTDADVESLILWLFPDVGFRTVEDGK